MWSWGKPAGWGGPWWDAEVEAGRPSDPFLMTGFEHECLHLRSRAERTVRFTVEVDFLGDGSWAPYTEIEVQRDGCVCRVFPAGFGAHWVRVTAGAACRATAHFTYT